MLLIPKRPHAEVFREPWEIMHGRKLYSSEKEIKILAII